MKLFLLFLAVAVFYCATAGELREADEDGEGEFGNWRKHWNKHKHSIKKHLKHLAKKHGTHYLKTHHAKRYQQAQHLHKQYKKYHHA